MESDAIEEDELFRAVARSGARAVLIGRRALVLLGLPLLTADYDFWLHSDDIECFNAALEPIGLAPNVSAQQARARGRYVLENGEHVDVLVVRELVIDGREAVSFDGVWERRAVAAFDPSVHVHVPCIEDLIATKRFAARPKDYEDIRLLEVLRKGSSS